MFFFRRLVLLSVLLGSASGFAAEGNAAKGRRAYLTQCNACHAPTAENRLTGPGLAGIVGRKAGASAGFDYSEAMKKSGLTWDEATLDKYLAKPLEIVPGGRMSMFVASAPTRTDIIAYLKTLPPAAPTATPAPAPVPAE
jgi:cytochrome c